MPYVPNADVTAKKNIYNANETRYKDWVIDNPNLSCYQKQKPSASEIVAKRVPLDSGGCNNCGGGLSNCNGDINFINSDVIPQLISAYDAYQTALNNDPNYKASLLAAPAEAAAAQATSQYKWIFAIVIVIIIAAAAFVWFKYFRKK